MNSKNTKEESNWHFQPNIPYQGGERSMTLQELSQEYHKHAEVLSARVKQLEAQRKEAPQEGQQLDLRLRTLGAMLRETRELAVFTERYYERGYRRNAKYTI